MTRLAAALRSIASTAAAGLRQLAALVRREPALTMAVIVAAGDALQTARDEGLTGAALLRVVGYAAAGVIIRSRLAYNRALPPPAPPPAPAPQDPPLPK